MDWPIRYRDLAPWYTCVERFVGVSGQRERLRCLPDGEFLPPRELNCAERYVKQSVEREFPGRKLTIARVADLTWAQRNRAAHSYSDPLAWGPSSDSSFSSLTFTLPAARKTGRLVLVTDAIVESVLYDERKDRATGVRVIDRLTREDREYHGRLIFLCASALASTQIMLNSTSRRFSTGIANGSGELGHNLMDHVFPAGACGDVPGMEDIEYVADPTGICIPRFRNLEVSDSDAASLGFVRGYGFQGHVKRTDPTEWGDAAVSGYAPGGAQRRQGPWTIWIGAFGECLPRHENYVSLDPERKDQWGMPLLRIVCSWSDNERKLMRDAAHQAALMLEAAGCCSIEPGLKSLRGNCTKCLQQG